MSDSHSTHPTGARSVWPLFFGALVLIGIFWVAAWLLRSGPSGANDEAANAEIRRKNLEELTAANETELTSYGWIDREKGIVRLPIDQAMELERAKLNEQEPRAAYPIATPAPAAPAAEPAPAGEAAATASAPEAVAAEPTPASEGNVEPAAEPQTAAEATNDPSPTGEVPSTTAPEVAATPEATATPAIDEDSNASSEPSDAHAEPTPPGADPRNSPEPTPTNEPS